MHTAHAIAGNAILMLTVLVGLAATVLASFRLGRERTAGRLGDPLDLELVRRWNAWTRG